MTKIRLNRDKRDILQRLAAEVIKDTPIDPTIEKRVKDAHNGYDKAHAAVVKAALGVYNKAYKPDDLKVLKRHGVLVDALSLDFVNLDTRHNGRVRLFNDYKFQRENLPKGVGHAHRLTAEEHNVYRMAEEKAMDKARVKVAEKGKYTAYLTMTDAMPKMLGDLKGAKDELQIAESADDEKRRTIAMDFNALIESARTFEDVCAVWPEAKTVSGEIVGLSQQVSLMSDDAVERIRQNMQTRGFKTGE